MIQKFFAVIGKNFGDEGKGLATHFYCLKNSNSLVVRHNGGAQSGHTVESNGRRFVFHELSSGSFCGADTYWADTYHPDLYKLDEELKDFHDVSGFLPNIYSAPDAGITLIDDVLVNMALENARGEGRHGSCGMGIYESVLRENAGYKVTVKDAVNLSFERLSQIRKNYLPKRLSEEGLCIEDLGEYGELLSDENVLINYCRKVRENVSFVKTVSFDKIINEYDQVIFENGQGLLLDEDNTSYYPNVTGSHTGLTNIDRLMKEVDYKAPLEVLYVSRSYVTRHGAGKLPCECSVEQIGEIEADATNIHNEWQGNIRYAKHESMDEFLGPVKEDLKKYGGKIVPSLLLTHLNETGGKIVFADGALGVSEIVSEDTFEKIYVSKTKDAKDIYCYERKVY